MSQILIVAGNVGQHVRALFNRASAIQSSLSTARLAERLESPVLCLATWCTENGWAPVLEQTGDDWRVGAGAWTGPVALPALEAGSSMAGYEGAFVFAAGARRKGAVRVATDPVGTLHVYATRYDGCTLIATSPLVLAAVSGADWDFIGVREFLAKGSVFGERTLHQHVTKLQPGRIIAFHGASEVRQQVYWAPECPTYDNHNNGKTTAAFASALTDAVRSTFRRAVHPVADLTGGFDSRLVLAAALRHHSPSTLDCTVSGGAGDGDVRSAAGIARALGLRLYRRPPHINNVSTWWTTALEALTYTDGEADVLNYADTLSVHRANLAGFDGSINGSGGELIRGYWWGLLWPHVGARNHFHTRRVAAARFANDPWAESLLSESFRDTLLEHFAGVLETELQGLHDWPNTALMDRVYLRLRMHRWQGRLASATNRVWPCFAPLLFRPVIAIALNTPVQMRRDGRMARTVLQHMNPKLAAFPMADGTPATPIRLNNIWQHLPRYRLLSQRIARRLRTGAAMSSVPDIRLLPLMQLDAVRQLLDPATMLTRSLYRHQALAEFLHHASSGRVACRHLGRIVTLELVARAAETSRRNSHLILGSD